MTLKDVEALIARNTGRPLQQASGSLLRQAGSVRGSALIGQQFTQPGYFQGRPSATAERPYNAQASGGSNLAGSNPALDSAVAARVRCGRAGGAFYRY
ncbi:hypothetical protein CRX72_27870 [Pantoea sp. BRM17]|nr:hypothetical protein CRX72_27870 [Pantoea sp. BRM17]